MSLKLDIVSPEQLFFSKKNIYHVVIPAYEGEMGILQDHIPIISFLKPGILKVYNSENQIDNFFIEDGIIEFDENCLTVLTSDISDLKNLDKLKIAQMISNAEKELNDENIDDNKKYLISQKLDTLKSFSLN